MRCLILKYIENLLKPFNSIYYLKLYILDIDSKSVVLQRNIKLNIEFAELKCEVPGYPVTHIWSCDGCGTADRDNTLILPKISHHVGQMEIITCTTSVKCNMICLDSFV